MFKWLKRNLFHGVNLNQWHYVGHSHIYFQAGEVRLANAYVYGFVNKKNPAIRTYRIVNGEPGGHQYEFTDHEWVSRHAELWKIGERDIWEIAQLEPGEWLKDHMRQRFNQKWSYSNEVWIDIAPTPVIERQEGSNVVSLQFKKPDESA